MLRSEARRFNLEVTFRRQPFSPMCVTHTHTHTYMHVYVYVYMGIFLLYICKSIYMHVYVFININIYRERFHI